MERSSHVPLQSILSEYERANLQLSKNRVSKRYSNLNTHSPDSDLHSMLNNRKQLPEGGQSWNSFFKSEQKAVVRGSLQDHQEVPFFQS